MASLPTLASAQSARKNPVSKVYVAEVSGDALIDTGETTQDLNRRSVYNAQGSIIETKRPESEADRGKYYSTMVYSNGTGAFFDAGTRVEVRRFVQEPFLPNRTDVDMEPSISQTQAFISRGTVALCTSKLVAGSSMTYQTPHGSVSIRGRRIVIEVTGEVTTFSMIEGDATVRAGSHDTGGHMLKSGQQAVIKATGAGLPNTLEISPIAEADKARLEEKASAACMAKRTVYFDVGDEGAPGVSAFDGAVEPGARELIPVEIVPTNLPVEFTVSPARIVTPAR